MQLESFQAQLDAAHNAEKTALDAKNELSGKLREMEAALQAKAARVQQLEQQVGGLRFRAYVPSGPGAPVKCAYAH